MILKTVFVLVLLYFLIFHPYWFTIGLFVVALYLTIQESDKEGR